MSLEGDNLRDPQDFDEDPHIIRLPPPEPSGELVFTLIVDKGATLTLDDGTIFTSKGIVMTNQKAVSGFVTVLDKDGYLIISLVNKDDEYG